ncbi:MAG: YeeE/YedE family protein [Verrucomicrobia bacterium]|nr:YeeE/YedE family protein [Verrucomicrobiota bacterium]
MNWILTLPLPLFALALLSGFVFGFLLRKGNVARFDVIVGQLLLKDFTVMKVILTAIVVGSLSIYTLDAFGLIPLFRLAKLPIFFSALGGGIFALGMSLSGYCPGTMIAAVADGAKDMIWGVVGMLVGTILHMEASVHLYKWTSQTDAFSKQTLSTYFGISPFVFITLLGLILLGLAWKTRRNLIT